MYITVRNVVKSGRIDYNKDENGIKFSFAGVPVTDSQSDGIIVESGGSKFNNIVGRSKYIIIVDGQEYDFINQDNKEDANMWGGAPLRINLDGSEPYIADNDYGGRFMYDDQTETWYFGYDGSGVV